MANGRGGGHALLATRSAASEEDYRYFRRYLASGKENPSLLGADLLLEIGVFDASTKRSSPMIAVALDPGRLAGRGCWARWHRASTAVSRPARPAAPTICCCSSTNRIRSWLPRLARPCATSCRGRVELAGLRAAFGLLGCLRNGPPNWPRSPRSRTGAGQRRGSSGFVRLRIVSPRCGAAICC